MRYILCIFFVISLLIFTFYMSMVYISAQAIVVHLAHSCCRRTLLQTKIDIIKCWWFLPQIVSDRHVFLPKHITTSILYTQTCFTFFGDLIIKSLFTPMFVFNDLALKSQHILSIFRQSLQCNHKRVCCWPAEWFFCNIEMLFNFFWPKLPWNLRINWYWNKAWKFMNT